MFEIIGDQNLIDVQTTTIWDANMNNYAGGNKLTISVMPGPTLMAMQNDLILMQSQLNTLMLQQDKEEELRKENPALQELYDQYKVVYTLVKKADDKLGDDGGG